MLEKQKQFENKEADNLTPLPSLLDIVKIDGRWAQVFGGGNIIKYLDDNSDAEINWDKFRLTKNWKQVAVARVKESADITAEELKHIRWGPEQEQYPHLKEHVSVFGEYEKRPEKE